jgi:hypothetical protein
MNESDTVVYNAKNDPQFQKPSRRVWGEPKPGFPFISLRRRLKAEGMRERT